MKSSSKSSISVKTVNLKDFSATLKTARDIFQMGKYAKAFDIYEQLIHTYHDKSVDLLAEVYDCYQLLAKNDRYNLYQARRFDFNIRSSDKVLDIGSGNDPFPHATHLAEIAIQDNNYGRAGLPFKYVQGKQIIICNIENMPFANKAFDFVYCSHVLEHADEPEKACKELMRIAKRGYVETPTRAKDLWLNTAEVSNHKWAIEYSNNTLIFTEYTPTNIKGLQCDILLRMHCNPETKREKAFSALIYLKPEIINVMFLWEDKFQYKVQRLLNRSNIYNNQRSCFLGREEDVQQKPEEKRIGKDGIANKRNEGMLKTSTSLENRGVSVYKHNHKLRFLQINTFYEQYLEEVYSKNPGLDSKSFDEQVGSILRDGFSAIHNFTPYIRNLGYISKFIIANCQPSQFQWLREYNQTLESRQNWISEITQKQIEVFKPDILFLSDAFLFDSKFIRKLSFRPALVFGWTGEPIPDGLDWSEFDAIFSNFSYSRTRALKYGAKSTEDFYPGFVRWLADESEGQSPEHDVVFVGQWSDLHYHRNQFITALAREASDTNGFKLGLYLCGEKNKMPPLIQKYCCGERFGIAMHKALRSGKIAINAGILKEAGNMRLFETTGTGVFLLTEYHTNIDKYFKPGEEVETFCNNEELIKKIYFYLKHPEKRVAIAQRGQERCLRDYSMEKQIVKLDEIIKKHLKKNNKILTSRPVQQFNPEKNLEVIYADSKLINFKSLAYKKRFGNFHVIYRGMFFYCSDLLSFYMAAKDIFLHRIYDFTTSTYCPIIIDCGGHIGLFTLFAKQKYPNAKIIVFEPDNESLQLLKKNIEVNGIKNVTVVDAGLYKYDGQISFGSDHSDGSTIFTRNKTTNIKVVRLSKHINSEIDFLKLNIEGAELDVLTEIESKLPLVKEMVIEYHGFPEIGQNLHRLLTILDRAGFGYLIHDFDHETNPATKPPFHLDKNTRFFLLIYAKRLFPVKQQTTECNHALRMQPISNQFGFDRGTPIDRYYIENFLKQNKSFIRGCVLEIGDNFYTQKYGSDVLKSDVLNAVPSSSATIVGNFATGNNIPESAFDCIIMTQTIQMIYDVKSALKNAIKALKPEGTLLITASGISQISRYDMDRWGEYWRFTDKSLKMLLSEFVPEDAICVESFGNVAVAKAFLDGLATHELSQEVLNYRDNDYQVLLTARVKKPGKTFFKAPLPHKSKKQTSVFNPLVLLYHRIAHDPIDAQLLAVSPENFEVHLKELAENYRVVPLHQLLKEVQQDKFNTGTIAVTFDDGYLDNLTNAVPLLEKYGLHATIFITSGMVGLDEEFWWDQLERIFLTGETLPDFLSITTSEGIKEWDLTKAEGRLKALDELGNILRDKPYKKIKQFINNLFDQTGITKEARRTHRTINSEQLKKLSQSPSIEIGSHAVTHTRLSILPLEEQQLEMRESRRYLESIIQKPVRLFSYPFGTTADFTTDTEKIVKEEGYEAGIANIQGYVTKPANMYSIPRRLVRNWSGELFAKWLKDEGKGRLETETISTRTKKLVGYQLRISK